jgi:hypothetical protein
LITQKTTLSSALTGSEAYYGVRQRGFLLNITKIWEFEDPCSKLQGIFDRAVQKVGPIGKVFIAGYVNCPKIGQRSAP